MRSNTVKWIGILLFVLAVILAIGLSINPASKLLQKGQISDNWLGPLFVLLLGFIHPIIYYKIGKKNLEQSKLVKWASVFSLIFLITIPFLFLEWVSCLIIYGASCEFGMFPPLSFLLLVVPGFFLHSIALLLLIIDKFKGRNN